jgi:hypothetical protein
MRTRLSALLIAVPMLFAACGDDDAEELQDDIEAAATNVEEAATEAGNDAAEAAVRNIATEQGEEQFADAGHPIQDKLTCEATTADGADMVDVSCTGTTEAGGQAALTGQTNEVPGASVVELEGNFTGTVDGTEVFTTQRLGG